MARRGTRTLTEVELEFMQVVWAEGEVSVEDVQAALRRRDRYLSDGSVRKMLSILVRKGYLSRKREGRRFVYAATVPKERANSGMVQDLLKRAFGGSAALMVASLMDGRGVGKRDLSAIKQLIAERERKGRK